jgi:hypothetical protein
MELFSKGLCIPKTGNIGVVMSALYMLFCGDKLRVNSDPSLQKFSVSLLDWYKTMKQPNSVLHPGTVDNAKGSMEINFIQVCHNYFQGDEWITNNALEWMYKSAVAIYVSNTNEAIGLVGSICVTKDQIVSYHPLLVNVKCHTYMEPDDIRVLLTAMKEKLNETRRQQNASQSHALCLLILIGGDASKIVDDGHDNESLDELLKEDTFRLVVVPKDDPFDICINVQQVIKDCVVAKKKFITATCVLDR